MNYSVLMSVYSKEKPDFLKIAIDSILNQTLKTNDFVIVCDGPLTESLERVILDASDKNPDIVHVYRYDENKGLGYALNYGLGFCQNDIVLRMDSDDYSFPNRAEVQVNRFIEDNIDLSSSTIVLFEDDPNVGFGRRNLPLTAEEIINFSKSRSPFNHPSVIFKKSKVLEAGGYKTLLYKEDYYLWIRMIQKGCKVNNLEQPLVAMRIDKNTFFKRKNKTVYKSAKWLNKYMLETKYIGKIQFIKNSLISFARQHLPNSVVAKMTTKYWNSTKS